MDRLIDPFMSFLKIKSTATAVASLIISSVLEVIGLMLWGFELHPTLYYPRPPADLPESTRWFLFGFYIIVFIACWSLLYNFYRKDAQDVYSFLREKLAGSWLVEYMPRNGSNPPFVEPVRIQSCITINKLNEKLELAFLIEHHPFFEDGEQIITQISLRSDEKSNHYNMFYYFDGKRKLRQRFLDMLLDDDENLRDGELDVQIFALLKFSYSGGDHVTSMEGEWFDLNGKLTQVFAIVDEANRCYAMKIKMEKKVLSQALLDARNFSSCMGPISFIRSNDAQG